MKVAIDIRAVSDFGVGTYIRNIIRALGRLDQVNEYFLLGPAERFREFQELSPNFLTVPFGYEENSARSVLDFDRMVRRLGCDLLHIPHLFRYPRRAHCPYLVTVHDLLSYFYPTRNGSHLRRLFEHYLTRRALDKAARILAVSHFTRKDITRICRIRPSKIEVVYNAIDDRLARGHCTDSERQMIAERYQVSYPFILYAGNIKPHKNVGRIIEAFSALKAALAKEGRFTDLKLIIIGDELSKHPDLRRTVIKSAVQNEVRFLGFVPIDVLRIFYDAAKIFVFPSLYEGFGLPPLEAMAHGTPVVTSNLSSIPEVVGDAAVLVNPENVFEIMRALYRVLLDQPLREELKRRGYQQVKRFSWEASAKKTLAVYQEIARG